MIRNLPKIPPNISDSASMQKFYTQILGEFNKLYGKIEKMEAEISKLKGNSNGND